MKAWIIYALLSAVAAGFVSICGKMGLKGLDSNAATAVRAIIMAVFLVGVAIVQGSTSKIGEIVANYEALLWIIASGVMGAISWLFYFMALQDGPVSQVAPIDKLSVVFSVILGIIIFHEKVSLLHGIAIAMITIGGLILAIFN